MKTREQIITAMCYSYRHDYGLDKDLDVTTINLGTTESERKVIWNQMAQIFDNDIAPNMEFKKDERKKK